MSSSISAFTLYDAPVPPCPVRAPAAPAPRAVPLTHTRARYTQISHALLFMGLGALGCAVEALGLGSPSTVGSAFALGVSTVILGMHTRASGARLAAFPLLAAGVVTTLSGLISPSASLRSGLCSCDALVRIAQTNAAGALFNAACLACAVGAAIVGASVAAMGSRRMAQAGRVVGAIACATMGAAHVIAYDAPSPQAGAVLRVLAVALHVWLALTAFRVRRSFGAFSTQLRSLP